LKQEGLSPASIGGYLSRWLLEQQLVSQEASHASLTAVDGASMPLKVGEQMLITAGGGPRPARIDAPLIFIGYGLHLPKHGHDDLPAMDLKGQDRGGDQRRAGGIVRGVKSHTRFERSAALGKQGALGISSLTTPKQVENSWERQRTLVRAPGMYLADAKLRDSDKPFFTASFDPPVRDAV
jgi:hypothetical protein